ncbi:vacuolar protein sorting 41 [Coprinopsis sp. MPI-PUGE-AT-0042]|nr:vacuolar protein sorting 41 [Coprinopsis sp. MPI-PUGE-AT-0042]
MSYVGVKERGNGRDESSSEEDDEEEEFGEDEEDEDEEEEESDDEDDEDDEEPTLKYARIEGSVPEVLKKDSASAISVSGNRLMALGTHAGIVHIMDLDGKRLKSYKPHQASIVDIEFDETGEWVATASIDGCQVHVRSISLTSAPASNEHYSFDLKRPMRTIALEPQFASKRGTRAFVCGGLAGNLVLYEKGWLGHRETVIGTGEGPIWIARWVGTTSGGNGLIAWASDAGVKIYHPSSRSLLTFIDRAANSPRSELFKPTLHWQDEATLLIAWADYIKVVRVRSRPNLHPSILPSSASSAILSTGASSSSSQTNNAPFVVEVTANFQMDACVVAGIAPHPMISSSQHEHWERSSVFDEKWELGASDKRSLHSKAPSTKTTATARTSETGDEKREHASPLSPEKGSLRGGHLRPSTPQRRNSMPITSAPPLTTFLLLTYTPPAALLRYSEDSEAPAESKITKRSVAERPELRIVSRSTGDELANDMLGVRDYEKWGCNEYAMAIVRGEDDSHSKPSSSSRVPSTTRDKGKERCYVVMSPRDLVLVRKRDLRDRVQWLVERERWDEALKEAERLEQTEALAAVKGVKGKPLTGLAAESGAEKEKEAEAEVDEYSVQSIGDKYMKHLVEHGEFEKAAELTPKVCGRGTGVGVEKRWEGWIWEFAEKKHLQTIIPYVPTEAPRLDHLVYEMILAHFLTRDLRNLYKTIQTWPREIYDIAAVILAVKAQLDKLEKGGLSSTFPSSLPPPDKDSSHTTPPLTRQEATTLLMSSLAELYTSNRQPGKALPYYLRLRRPNVFELIREHNLFTDVQDQVLLLVEFDHELMEKRRIKEESGKKADGNAETKAKEGAASGAAGRVKSPGPPAAAAEVKQWEQSDAIQLLVNNIHSIPINRVVQQLQSRPYYLFLYLDALVEKDPHLVSGFADLQVKMYAEFAVARLIDFLRTSNYYNLEQAYKVCQERDLVLEMVFLLGRMGDNKKALTLIIERLGDVERAIEFAKAQNDDDLWEDLLRYSETRPTFIRGLLENVGVEISPIRLIRRIRNGLEIPGLKEALIKILQDFHLQIELLEGCKTILEGDCAELGELLGRRQGGGLPLGAKSKCPVCNQPLLFHQHLVQIGEPAPSSTKPSIELTGPAHSPLTVLFLCRHVVHASCAGTNLNHLPTPTDPVLRSVGYGSRSGDPTRDGARGTGMSGIIAL